MADRIPAYPLFYECVVALDRDAHKDLRLRSPEQGFSFARSAHLIPALVEEFSAAAMDVPIAFLPGPQQPSPVFVAGLAPGESILVSDEGQWDGRYVPAYLRRYPFIIGDVSEGQSILCMDKSFDGLGTTEGDPLFTPKGEPSERVTAALALAERYRLGALRTEAFCATIQRLGLLRSVTLDAKQPSGRSTVVHGLLTIDEAAFDALPDEQLIELRKEKYLTPIYAHLFSLRALDRLNEKLIKKDDAAAA